MDGIQAMQSHPRALGRLALAASLVLATSASRADGPGRSPPTDDRASRSPEINWPKGFDPDKADLFAHNEIRIAAPCSKVWSQLVAITGWPRWYANASDVKILDKTEDVRKGTRFTWKTFGLDVESVVAELVPPSRLGWFGRARDIEAYHAWLLIDTADDCRVITEESANGSGARALVKTDPQAMHRGHDLWLTSLKKSAAP